MVGQLQGTTPFEGCGSWPGVTGFLCEQDSLPLDKQSGRAWPVEAALLRVQPLRSQLGISRIADVTGYDYLGFATVTATRPGVSTAQITATQGKGVSYSEALASALFEAVERFSAAAYRPLFAASASELQSYGALFPSAVELGLPSFGSQPVEWVSATSLRSGQVGFVPAADVLFPYWAPTGMGRPMRPSTTGLASGNSLAEAITHAIAEVVERDAVSRFMAGEPAPLVDLKSLSGSLEGEIVERFSSHDVDLLVFDLSHLAALPTFFAASFGEAGPGPATAVAGQGSHVVRTLALRRALLETAQSRVVAIQGSREDLIRHAGAWGADRRSASLWWKGFQQRAAGVRRFVADPQGPVSARDLLYCTLERLEAVAVTEVFVTNLTAKEIGIPVVHTLIPGLVDTIVDPARRRRDG